MDDQDDEARLRLELEAAGTDRDNSPPRVGEAIAMAVTTEHRLASERIRKRALKAMILDKAGIWRRFLRRRLPSDA